MTKSNASPFEVRRNGKTPTDDFNPLHWTACFTQPAKLSDVRSWQQHIPFAFWLVEVLKPSCFVELGTHKGDSYLAFCQAVSILALPTRCYAVDTWRGDEHAGLYDDSVYDELSAYHNPAYGGFSRLLRMTFDEAAENFADKSVDLLHIDGLHTYEAVKHDFETWRSKLSDDAVVIFHDINVRENEFGVWRYWSELERNYPTFAFHHGNGLGVLAAGRNLPKTLAPLFSLSEQDAGIVRQLFHALGSRVQGNVASQMLAATRHAILLNGVQALDAVLDQHGLEHEQLSANPSEHELGRHLIWTHRALAKLSRSLHESNLTTQKLSAESTRLQAQLEKIHAADDARKAATRLHILRDTLSALDLALDASGIAHDSLPENADEHEIGRHAIWTHRGLAKLSHELSERDRQVDLLSTQIETDRATFSRSIEERDQTLQALRGRLSDIEAAYSSSNEIINTLRSDATKAAILFRELRNAVNELVSSVQASKSDEDLSFDDDGTFHEIERSLASTRQAIHDLTSHLHERTAQLRQSEDSAQMLRSDTAQLQEHLKATRQHATNLEGQLQQLRRSLSWRLSAPVRWLGYPVAALSSSRLEQVLYRAYYALPGLSYTRKRALIVWLHKHATFFTRHTLSFRLHEQTENMIASQMAARHGNSTALSIEKRRMDQSRADSLIASWENPPRISIAMPVYNVEEKWLVAAVDSVRNQFYPNWELCIVDDGSTREETLAALDQIETSDPRIKVLRQRQNGGIAAASNAALALATGDFVGLLDNDDALTRDALLEVARRIVNDDPDVLYSDEDKLDENEFLVEPHFKPNYNEEYLQSINYICHFLVARTDLVRRIGGFRAGFDGAQDYDLILRLVEATEKIAHIPMVLYHWRRIPGSTSASAWAKPHTSEAGLKALTDSLARRKIDAQAMHGPYPNTYRVKRRILGAPLVSIIIPFRDKPALLDTCVSSVLTKTSYTRYEVLCIDNGSVEPETARLLEALEKRDKRVRVIKHDVPFNYSTINNFAASQAKGEYFLFLNNDTEVIDGEWLEAMLEHAQRPEIGVVGAKLLYADDTIQHAGVVVGMGGVAGHGHLFLPKNSPGYFGRAQLIQRLSSVTFACAMVRRDVFEKVGGLNETDLKIAFNDVDFCLRVREAGYHIVYTPYATLYHYESKSRGYEDTPEKQARFGTEVRYMQKRHASALLAGDPFYNPNLTLFDNFKPDLSYVDKLPA